MAAPKGNQFAKKHRMFYDALLRELKQRDLQDGDGETLRKIAATWVDAALSGDMQTGREIRDTIDGKLAQNIDIEQRTTVEFGGLPETVRLIEEITGTAATDALPQSLPH